MAGMWPWIIFASLFAVAFGVAWWLIFRGVRRYPNLHNHHDDRPGQS